MEEKEKQEGQAHNQVLITTSQTNAYIKNVGGYLMKTVMQVSSVSTYSRQ